MENKSKICKKLLPVLQMTRNLYDLVDLEYVDYKNGEEEVITTFINGTKKHANVSMDSGTAMIYDIIRQIV